MGNLERKLKEKKDIVRKMERDETLDVEESLRLYEQGEILLEECDRLLKEAEEKVKKLVEK